MLAEGSQIIFQAKRLIAVLKKKKKKGDKNSFKLHN